MLYCSTPLFWINIFVSIYLVNFPIIYGPISYRKIGSISLSSVFYYSDNNSYNLPDTYFLGGNVIVFVFVPFLIHHLIWIIPPCNCICSILSLWFSYLFFACYPLSMMKFLYQHNSFFLFLMSPLTWIIVLYLVLTLGYSLYYHMILSNYNQYKYHRC